MTLAPGARLGPHEIVSALGAGGMGEVYRATDTNLKRQVAIKVLPASLAADADRLARFQREAEVLAALNHPNIAAIYGLEKTPEFTALVMELVEGDDLSQRIPKGGMPIDEALPVAKQIAEALEAAHEQGIIHRDLKPANIKVRPDGTVKVLDFGLAKALDPAASSTPGLSMSPTITTPAMTQAGMILGTAAYMSPEQARGRAVDRRADIWAFGAVLFEMLTGTRAFAGEDVTDTLSRVLQREPDFDALPATVPPTVRVYVRRCLQKDPKQRVGDIRDVRLALEGAFDAAPPQGAAAAAPARRTPTPWMVVAAAAVLAAGALALPAVRHLSETPPPETRLDIVTPPTTQPEIFELSPDGAQIVFVASDAKTSRLWLRSLSTTEALPLAGTDGATRPFWSPDSRSIGFFAEGFLKRLDLGGGAPLTLAPVPNGLGGTWNADDVIVFAPSATTPLMQVSASGGTATALTTLAPQQQYHYRPRFLADGRRFVFGVGGSEDVDGIYLGTLDGSAPTRLIPHVSAATPAPGDWLLWLRAGALVAQRLDAEQRVLTGNVVTVADHMPLSITLGQIPVSVSATGLVAYRTGEGSERQLTWFDRSGVVQGVVGEPDGSLLSPRVSPDGRRIAVSRMVQDNADIWLLDGARSTRLTFFAGRDIHPVWSPDGSRIVYQALGQGKGELWFKLTSGAGEEMRLLGADQVLTPTSVSPDGGFFMYNSVDTISNGDLWALPLSGSAGRGTPFVFLKTPFREVYGSFSPDGRWVAYHSNESGRNEVYVRPFVPPGEAGSVAPAAAGQVQISIAGGIHPAWRPDGQELYYINPDGDVMAAPIVVTGAAVEPGVPVKLFATRIHGGGADIQQGRQYEVTRDGRFLINARVSGTVAPITLLQHWNPDAKKQ